VNNKVVETEQERKIDFVRYMVSRIQWFNLFLRFSVDVLVELLRFSTPFPFFSSENRVRMVASDSKELREM
jgi:hypothetical protein